MEKLELFFKDYESSAFESLPKFLKRRVDALKKLQYDHLQIQIQYHKELQDLEMKYEKLYQPLYEKRQKIVNGDYEPTSEDCKLPECLEHEGKGDQENKEDVPEPIISEAEEKALESKVKGIPGFWMGALISSYNFADSIEPHDKPILRHLKDIQLRFEDQDVYLAYKLDFIFDSNPYFTDKVLTKTYYLKKTPDLKDVFSFEGYEVTKSEGCEIHWNAGKDVTKKVAMVKQKNKKDGRIREKKKEVEQDSFFYFFKPPQLPDNSEEIDDEELASIVGIDFELGEIIRQYIIPKAVLYYTGYMLDVESDDEEFGDGLGNSDDSDSDSDLDDSDESSGSEEPETESDDSLEQSKDSKKLIANKSSKSPAKKSQ